jgi:hypothetical protein
VTFASLSSTARRRPALSSALSIAARRRLPPHTRDCITDEASPFALRSTRNRPRTAVRRGASWTYHLQLTVAVVARPDGVCPAERPADIQRSGIVALVDPARTPATASVAGRCPASGVPHPVSSSGIRRSSRPVSSPSGVRSPGFVVQVSGGPVACGPPVRCPALWCPPGQRPAGWCPPVGPDVSVSSHTGRWRWAQVGAAGTRHHGNGSSPGGLPRR